MGYLARFKLLQTEWVRKFMRLYEKREELEITSFVQRVSHCLYENIFPPSAEVSVTQVHINLISVNIGMY